MSKITLKYIIDFFVDKSIITTNTKSNILELFQYSDEKCEKKFNDFIEVLEVLYSCIVGAVPNGSQEKLVIRNESMVYFIYLNI